MSTLVCRNGFLLRDKLLSLDSNQAFVVDLLGQKWWTYVLTSLQVNATLLGPM